MNQENTGIKRCIQAQCEVSGSRCKAAAAKAWHLISKSTPWVLSAYEEDTGSTFLWLPPVVAHVLKPEFPTITVSRQNVKTGTANTAALKHCPRNRLWTEEVQQENHTAGFCSPLVWWALPHNGSLCLEPLCSTGLDLSPPLWTPLHASLHAPRRCHL